MYGSKSQAPNDLHADNMLAYDINMTLSYNTYFW